MDQTCATPDALAQAISRAREGRSERLLELTPRSAQRVLLCRCRDGVWGQRLRDRGAQHVSGIDPDAQAVEKAAQVLSEAVCGDLETMPLPFDEESFDCIVLDEVLPCLRDSKRTIDRIVRLLRPAGLLIATAPNVQFAPSAAMLAEGRVEYAAEGVWAREHIRFYTAQELLRLFWDGGLGTARVMALVSLPTEALPLDEDRCLHLGRVSIGPVNETEYAAFRTEEYAILGASIEASA